MSKHLIRFLALAATLILWLPALAADRPNVIIILADDLGYGDLSCYGHPKFKTPHLDQMAKEGARLTNFYASTPYCAPTRGALITGRYPFRNGLVHNPFPIDDPQVKTLDHIGLPTREITLGRAMSLADYQTCCIGKWHLGHQPKFHPLQRGFHEYLGILYSNDMHRVELWDGNKVIEYPVIQATLTKRYTERALDFIERMKDKPFLLYLPHAMVHKPLAASEEFYKKSGAGLYGDTVAELDWSTGQILAKLKELNIDDNTLVVFTSDNGPYYGGSTGGFRGMKGQSYEGGFRVPMIARWPGKIPAGQVIDEPAVIMDLFTTSLTLAGAEIPSDRTIDGKNIMPLLTEQAKSPHEAIFCTRGPQIPCVRSGPWKLHVIRPGPDKPRVPPPDAPYRDIRGPDGIRFIAPFDDQGHPSQYPGVVTGDPFDKIALYNLETDPAEQQNVADEHPEIVKRLKALWDEANKRKN